ncbi:hypothetical protein JoomaDRAFT_2195 [Galbibacter orientalis DSM 19592]|uniref:Uncharacterized protein n=1 Tax=Galbibacter orientalis DSM 19592 TaxID=926559 RepID=I3C6E2_9FLAO|nr:hypothetical protein JoomaDRAFT_2195 [Galbibacter orientalis DSM 19592]
MVGLLRVSYFCAEKKEISLENCKSIEKAN